MNAPRRASESTSSSSYDSDARAAAYAYARPAVHAPLLSACIARLSRLRSSRAAWPVARALDVGCGAGVSTAALAPWARLRVGVDPVRRMVRMAAGVAPGARFACGTLEHVPLHAGTFDLITAAGVLYYGDPALYVPELSRVLGPDGALVVYDFAPGSRFDVRDTLAAWFAAFCARCPGPAARIDQTPEVPWASAGLTILDAWRDEVRVTMSRQQYLAYILGESRVSRQVDAGTPRGDIEAWCDRTLRDIWDDTPRHVVFETSAAVMVREVT